MAKGGRDETRPTMRDVAEAAGVSKALVSIVFREAPGASEQTRERVFAAAAALGYRPNRTASLLALSRTRQLGVVVDLHNTFLADLVDAAVGTADEHGYRLILSPWTPDHDEVRAIGSALELRCEALLLLGPGLERATIARLTAGIPVVSVGRVLDLPNVDVVRGAEEVGMEQVVEHLVALGHRRIAHVDGGADEIAASRRAGFSAGVRRSRVLSRSVVIRGGRSEEDGRRAATEFLRRRVRPTAIAAFNDHCALGVIDTLSAAGLRVPDDVSVTGYDDAPVAALRAIDLTTVRQDAAEFARLAVAAAVERLDGGRVQAREWVLTPELIVRGTSAGPPR